MIPFEALENELFAAWQKAEGEEKDRVLPLLTRELRNHARRVAWLQLQRDVPDIASVAVWKAIGPEGQKFRGESAFTTWFHRVVINLCNDFLREKQKTAELEEESHSDLEGGVIAKLDLERVKAGMQEEDKRLLELLMEGYTLREISAIEGSSLTTMSRRRQELLERVRRGLNGNMG